MAALAGSWIAEPARAAGPNRPNIVIVLADDLTWNDMGFMGSPCARTPNLDRIAAQGAVFDRLYTCTSVCAPTRFQLNTGRMPAFGSVFGNTYSGLKNVKEPYDTLPERMQDAGYRAAIAGKRHFPDDDLPSEQWKFNYEKLSEEHSDDTPKAAANYLKRPHDRPFVLYVGLNEPHVAWSTKGSATYDPATLKLPEYMPDTPVVRETMAAYSGEVTALDDKAGVVFDALQASPYKDNTLFLFMTEQGSQIPRGKISCHELGIRATMIAWWPGKIAAGRRSNALMHYVDVMPTLLELAGAPPAEGIDGKSFLPVLMGKSDAFRDEVYGAYGNAKGGIRSVWTAQYKYIYTDVEPGKAPNHLYGRANLENWVYKGGGKGVSSQSTDYFLSVMAAQKAGSKDPRVDVIVENGKNPPAEQLYDLENDPYELNNLAASSPELVQTMRQQLANWLEQQKDPLAKQFTAFATGVRLTGN